MSHTRCTHCCTHSVSLLFQKKVTLFGRDLSEIPCFRNSWLYGISGGIGVGLLYFLFTSKTRMASHVAVGSVCTITMSYWLVFTNITTLTTICLNLCNLMHALRLTLIRSKLADSLDGTNWGCFLSTDCPM